MVKKRGGGKLIVKEVFKLIKNTSFEFANYLSPLTEMARKFHLSNGAVQIQLTKH